MKKHVVNPKNLIFVLGCFGGNQCNLNPKNVSKGNFSKEGEDLRQELKWNACEMIAIAQIQVTTETRCHFESYHMVAGWLRTH